MTDLALCLTHRANGLLAFALLILATGCAYASQDAPPNIKQQPNVLLILADDLGYECITANGGESYKTPRLDALAAGGLRFTNCHSQPLCTPSRVQLMTGIYNNRNYIRFGLLDPDAHTFAQLFRDAGYATTIAGKWQLGGGFDQPSHFGFDEYCLWQLTREGPGIAPRYPNPGLEINGKIVNFTDGEYGPEIVSDYLCDFIERKKDQPFFAYYPMILPHFPFQPTPDSEGWNPAESREYPRGQWRDEWWADMVSYTDKMVGKLVDKLRQEGLLDNTIIVFVGDNGTYFSLTSRFNGQDIQGGKGKTIDTGTHVPLIVHWPATIKPGRTSDSLIDFSDFLPTLAQTAGLTVPETWEIDGISFASELSGGPASPRQYIYCWYERNGKRNQASQYVRTAHFKLYANGNLFDTADDPNEKQPLDPAKLNETQRAEHQRLEEALARHLAITQQQDDAIKTKQNRN